MPKFYGQLEKSQLENIAFASEPASAARGRIYWDTTNLRIRIDNGTSFVSVLANDQKAVFGTNGTASSNIRFNRAAASVLQLVTGDDTTAEGSLSTALAQLSVKVEGYATGSLPAAGRAGRWLFDTTTAHMKLDNGAAIWDVTPLTTKGDIYTFSTVPARLAVGSDAQVLTADSAQATGVKWATPASAPDSSKEISNLTFTVTSGSPGANELTIAIKNKAGSDPSVGDPCRVGFRDVTVTNGSYTQVLITGALSVVIDSTSTLGFKDATTHYLYIYLINNGGTAELAVSGTCYDEGSVISTSAESASSGGTADSISVVYSTTARSNVPHRLIGRVKFSLTTAGTWNENGDELSLVPFDKQAVSVRARRISTGQTIADNTNTTIVLNSAVDDTHNLHNTTTGLYTVPKAGYYLVTGACALTGLTADVGEIVLTVLKGGAADAQLAEISIGLQATQQVEGSRVIKCAAADTLGLRIIHNNGGNRDTATGSSVEMTVTLLSEIV